MFLTTAVLVAAAPTERVLVSVSGLSGDAAAVASADATAAVARLLIAYEVTSDRDVATAVELEAQRQIGGCSSEACVAEIADALGARWVVSVELVDVDGSRQAMAALHDTRALQVLARSSRSGDDAAAAAASDVASALAPSGRPLAFAVGASAVALVGVGSGVAAALFGLDASARDAALARVRDPDDAVSARSELERVQATAVVAGVAALVCFVVAGGLGVAAFTAP